MTKDQIKKGLATKGYDFSMLAQVISRSPSLLSKVAARKARSLLAAQAIAKALDIPVEEVFPDVPAYHVDNTPIADLKAARQAELRAKFEGG